MSGVCVVWISPNNGGITDISSNREHPSLFRPFHLVAQNCFLQSFLDMLPPLLPKGKTGGMSGGHFESLTAVSIHEVQNIIAWFRILLYGTEHNCLCTAALEIITGKAFSMHRICVFSGSNT